MSNVAERLLHALDAAGVGGAAVRQLADEVLGEHDPETGLRPAPKSSSSSSSASKPARKRSSRSRSSSSSSSGKSQSDAGTTAGNSPGSGTA